MFANRVSASRRPLGPLGSGGGDGGGSGLLGRGGGLSLNGSGCGGFDNAKSLYEGMLTGGGLFDVLFRS